MDKIGKTIMAKIAFNDIKDIYGASYFVECSKRDENCFTISYKILEEFKEKRKPIVIEEPQEMLEAFFMKNKIILVFDNVQNKNKIKDIVSIDILFASNGITLIVTT